MMNSTTRSSRSLSALALSASLMLAPLGVAHAETTPPTPPRASPPQCRSHWRQRC